MGNTNNEGRERVDTASEGSPLDEMTKDALSAFSQRKSRRGFLKSMEGFLLGMMGVAAFPGLRHARAQASDSSGVADVALKVQFPEGEAFTLAVPRVEHGHRTTGVVWVPGTEQRMGVKMIPQPDTGSGVIRVEFVGVMTPSDDMPATADGIKGLSGVGLGSYELSQGSPIELSGRGGFSMPALSVSLVPVDDWHCCCTCGSVTCCPNGGFCLGCSGCGTCCKEEI
jgi:hypothetical protein